MNRNRTGLEGIRCFSSGLYRCVGGNAATTTGTTTTQNAARGDTVSTAKNGSGWQPKLPKMWIQYAAAFRALWSVLGVFKISKMPGDPELTNRVSNNLYRTILPYGN